MNKIKKILPIILAFVLVFGSCLTVNAEESEDPYNIANLENIGNFYVRKSNESNIYQYISSNVSVYYDSSKKVLCSADKGRAIVYNSPDLRTWTYITSINLLSGDTVCSLDSYTLLQSNQTIYDETGELFFLGPVAPIQAALVALPETMNNQVAVILTIAIACLALLITLSVLRKKLPIFLH